jgi:hypothetical protein
MAASASFVPVSELLDSWTEPGLAPADGEGILDQVGIDDFAITERSFGPRIDLTLAFKDEIGFDIPGLDGFGLYLGSKGSTSSLAFQADLGSVPTFRLLSVSVVIRLPSGLFNPVEPDGTGWKLKTLADGSVAPFEIAIGGVDIEVSNGRFDLKTPQGGPAIALPPVMIGDSGVVVESSSIQLYFDRTAAPPTGQSPGFQGIYIEEAAVHMPGDVGVSSAGVLKFEDCAIGAGGFTGSVSYTDNTLTWNTSQQQYTGTLAGSAFGFTAGLKSVQLGFTQNALTKGALVGEMYVPYLERRIGVALSLSLSGDIAVALAAPQSTNPDPNVVQPSPGLIDVKEPGVVEASLSSIGFEKRGDDLSVSMSGRIRPLFGGVDWPSVELKALTVHSDGRVDLGGGWLEIPQQKATNFHGFPLEVRKIGLGQDPAPGGTGVGKQWVGFSGGLKLIDGLPVGGSVEGLKLKWDPTDPGNASKYELELQGIAVSLRIPEVLDLDGSVAFFSDGGKQWFQGGAKVVLHPLACSLDAQLLVGSTPEYTFFYIFLEVGLPVGIPLAQTGLAIYGMGGLFGYNVKPGRRQGEPWYEGWYKRPPEGPTGAAKWTDERNRMAFGATLTIGTLPDNGQSINARVLLILTIPGPMILIEGRANLVKDRKELLTSDPLFKALAVIDGEAGTFLLNVEPHFVYPDTGDVIDVTGIAEAFFDFNHSDRWYLNVGVRDPREKRIRAQVIKLFQANAYLMLNQKRLALGAYIGYDARYAFGPVVVRLGFWIEADAEIIFRPLQFAASAGLHGRVELKAFGFGLALEVDAQAALKTATPFEFSALIRVKADLPWPLPDPQVEIPYEYKEEAPPPVPVPLQTVEVVSRKVAESWSTDPTGNNPLVVPVDGKPVINFAKSMHDNAGVAGNIQPAGSEKVGDLDFSYHLDSVVLERLEQGSWVPKAGRPTPTGGDDVYGMWMPITAGDTPPNSKLMLFVKTPFDAVQNAASNSAAEEFAQKYPEYPCVFTCVDFDQAQAGPIASGFHHEGVTVAYNLSAYPWRSAPEIHDPRGPTRGGHQFRWSNPQTLRLPDFTGAAQFSLSLPEEAAGVKLRLSVHGNLTLKPFRGGQPQTVSLPGGGTSTFYTGGSPLPTVNVPHVRYDGDQEVILGQSGITRIEFSGTEVELFEVCWLAKPPVAAAATPPAPGTNAYTAAEAQRGADAQFQLEPGSTYRLRTKTHVSISPSLSPGGWPVTLDPGPLGPTSISQQTGQPRYDFEHTVYFETEGPPGFMGADIDRSVKALPAPAGAGNPEAPRSRLRTLEPYVARAIPSDGATAVYRGYDVAVEFGEAYVERMYDDHGRALELDLRDRNGNPPAERANGSLLVGPFDEDWIEADEVELTPAEQLWVYLLDDAMCEIQLPPKPKNDVLKASPGGPVLAPQMTYVATLRPDPVTNAFDTELYSFSFTSSAFATFAHHVHSFSGRLWDCDQLLDSPLTALSSTQRAALQAAAQAGDPAAFESLAGLFELPHDTAQRWGFLIESPEPLPPSRVDATLRSSATTTAEARHTGPVRIRDAAFGDRTGTNYNAEWVELLVTEGCVIADLELQHLTTAGDPSDFTTLDTITGTGRYQPGDLIRIHAGAAPSTPPNDGRQHLYLTASGATPSWMLHAGKDILRLVEQGGREVSRQQVCTGFSAVSAKWIWNRDNTRALVLPAQALSAGTAAPLPDGTYRIEWSFELDISSTDGSQPVLRRNGSAAAETAVTQFAVKS